MSNHQQEDNNLYIRCIQCGEVYTVNPDEYSGHDLSYNCDKCGNEMVVRFFGHCDNCDAYIGFTDDPNESTLKNFAKGFLKGYFDSENTFDTLLDNIPRANAAGVCMNCGLRHIECPQCGTAVFVPMDSDRFSDVFCCPNCGVRMRHP